MITLYSKDGQVKVEKIKKFSYSGKFMGECFITAPFAFSDILNFDIGDYVMFRDEQFVLNYIPAKKKQASKGSYGKAFEYDNVKFNSLADELTRIEFIDVVKHDNNISYSSQPTFSFYANSVHDLVDRIQANLDLEFKGDKKWTIIVSEDIVSPSKNISVSNISVADAVVLINTEFGLNFTFKNRTLTIGESGLAVGKVFAYGKDNGLFDIQQTTNQDAKIITRLRAFGSTRNIPRRYYNNLKNEQGKPYILESDDIKNLMLPSFPYEESDPRKLYLDSDNIEKYGVRYGSVYFDSEENEIYPSIEGMTKEQLNLSNINVSLPKDDNGNLDEILGADNPSDDGLIPDEGKGKIDGEFKIYLKDLGFDLTEKDKDGQYKYQIAGQPVQIAMKSGMCVGREFDVVENGIKKDTSLGYTRYVLELKRFEDDNIKGGTAFPNSVYAISRGDKFVILGIEMPDVYVKSASQKLLVAAQEYLSQNDETKYSYQPTISSNFMARNPQLGESIKEGDIFTFKDDDLQIDASEIIQTLNIEYNLDSNPLPTYKVVLSNDKIASRLDKMQNSINTLVSNGTGITINQVKSLISTIGSAMFLRKDISDSTDHLQKFNKGAEFGDYKNKRGAYINEEGKADLQEVQSNKVTTKDLVATNTKTTKLEAIESTLSKATINDLVAQLAKMHSLTVEDTANILKAVVGSISSEKFVSGFAGEGFRIAQAINGDWNLEIDNVIVRKVFSVFELIIQKITHQGGMVIHSPNGAKITKVTDGGSYWKCEHDSATDFFKDDQILCQNFSGDNVKRYWRLATSAGKGYVNLSKTDQEANSSIPSIGDEIVVLGNRTNINRQSAIMVVAVGNNAPYTAYYSNINSYSLVGKESTRIGNLNGVVDKDFGALKGYGLYATNAYLKGILRLTNGKTVEQELLSTNNIVEANRLQLGGEIDKAKADAKNAQDSVDNLQIGGKNLFQLNRAINKTEDGFYTENANNTYIGLQSVKSNLVVGEIYTFFAKIKYYTLPTAPYSNGSVAIAVNAKYNTVMLEVGVEDRLRLEAGEEVNCRHVFKVDSINSEEFMRGFSPSYGGVRPRVIYTQPKLVLGDVAKKGDWSPAPEDQQAELNKQITSVRTDFDVIEGQINANVKETQRLISVSNEQVNQATEASNKAQQNADKAKLDADLANKKALEAQINADKTKADANASNQSKLDAQAKADEAKAQADKANQEAIKAKSDADKALDSANKAKEAQDKSEGVLQSVATKEAGINVVAGQVDIKAKEATESATRAETAEANINTKADGIVMEASKQSAEKAIDGLEIGGRNLLPVNTGMWEVGSISTPTGGNWPSIKRLRTIEYINAESNQDYYVSFYSDHKLVFLAYDESGEYIGYLGSQPWELSSGVLKTPHNTARLRFVLAKNDDSSITLSDLAYVKIMLEKGNKPTDWSPAPEDIEAQFQATKARFELLDNQISAEVSKTDGIRTDLTTLSQDHDSFKVQVKTDIDGAIDSNNEVIKSSFTMNGNKIGLLGSEIDITGKVTFSALNSESQSKINTANSTASTALSNANNAQSSANNANSSLTSLKSSLGDLAYAEKVEKSQLGTTVIEGGFLKTELIQANSITADKLDVSEITDNTIIGGFVFINKLLISQEGTDAEGNFSTNWIEYKTGNFKPNLILDPKKGSNTALEGQFGLFYIVGKDIIGKSADGNEVMRITANKVPDASVFNGEWVLVSMNTDIFNDSFFFDNTSIPNEVIYRGDWSTGIKCDKVGQYRIGDIYTAYNPSLANPEMIGNIVNTITVRDPRGSIVKREAIRDGDVVFYANTPGTYSVTCDVFIEFTPRFGGKDVAMTIAIDSSFQGVLYKSTPPNTTLIGSDGLYTSFSSEEFLHYKANEGFILRSGNYGLRVSKSGIQKWNGSQWVTANI